MAFEKPHVIQGSRDTQDRQLLLLWLGLLLATTVVLLMILNRTHYASYMNFDEYAYAMPGMAWVNTGYFSTDYVYPEGFFEHGNYYMIHPQLSAYMEALTIWVLGFSRLSIRLPSLLLYVLSAGLLYYCWRKLGGEWLKGLVLAVLFFGSPFVVLASSTARPEMLSGFLIFLACAAALHIKKTSFLEFALPGFLGGVATYNHPVFFGAACLPLLLALQNTEVSPREVKSIVKLSFYYACGALAALVLVALLLIVPHLPEWREQFLGAVSTPYFHSKEVGSLFETLLSMKRRFSTFGYTYLAWYIVIAAAWVLLFRYNFYFVVGFTWITAWMFVVHLQTQLVITYCTQFAFGAVVATLLAGPARFHFENVKALAAFLMIFVAAVSMTHWLSVTSLLREPSQVELTERRAASELARLPKGSVISGLGASDLASIVVLSGHIYYFAGLVPYSAEQNARHHMLVKQQARYWISEDGSVTALATE